MDEKKLEIMKNRPGFIAALDQSGGSSAKTLRLYGIEESEYNGEDEMFDLIHAMRTRVMKSKEFTSEKIVGVILFEQTMNRKIDDKYTSDYLWDKEILSFLKVDKGLEELANGVQLMKEIPGLEDTLDVAIERGIFGTKMRSVIKEANAEGIKKIVKQQFDIAKVIAAKGLVPIIEPEVDINAPDKEKCEEILRKDVMEDKHVVKVVALSGGYEREDACERLARNEGMIASFSRALLEGLKVSDSDEEFDKKLADSIDLIYKASI